MPTQRLLQLLHEITEELIPFNKVLGLKVESLDLSEAIRIRFEMRPELVGNFTRGNLHGGVIASVLDVVGGMMSWVGIMKQMEGRSFEEIAERFAKIGTIDMRVDYLRAGLGSSFVATGSILRTGSKVAVARMELHNDQGVLIATGTGTYIVG